MAEFSIGGRTYTLDRLRFGEIKALAVINAEPVSAEANLLDRYARIIAVATARFGAEAFVVSDDAECSLSELVGGARAVLTLGGFLSGEAAAAAPETQTPATS